MWGFAILIAAVAALQCPKFSCMPLVTDKCLQVSNETVVLASCRRSFVCPMASLQNLTDQVCAPAANHTIAHPDFGCLPRRHEGSSCGLEQPCFAGLYCNSTRLCAPQVSLGAQCTHLRECGNTAVCNQGMCVPIFSQPAGARSDSRMACQSGLIRNGTCLEPVQSKEALPVVCNSDSDCVGTDHSTTKCECGTNHLGFAYCHLHPSDRPVLKFLKSIHFGEVEEAMELRYWIVNYPKLVDSESCFENSITELQRKEMLDSWESHCEAGLLLVLAVYLQLL